MKEKETDRRRLLTAATCLRDLLATSEHRGVFRLRAKLKATRPNSDGWRVRLGSFGRGQPHIEIWSDKFTLHTRRVLWACLYSPKRKPVETLVKRVGKQLLPSRVFTPHETTGDSGPFRLKERLAGTFYGQPILERYKGETYFGVYDHSRGDRRPEAVRRFCREASALLLQLAEALPKAKGRALAREIYPRFENVKKIAAHLARERSSYLAKQRKELDKYRCQVCGMSFAEVYGKELGEHYAEAHHLYPLGKLGKTVKTTRDDLITVCANCHRMLHRMEGLPQDVARLRRLVRSRA